MKQTICTISTSAYLPKVEVLYQSLKDNNDFEFYCLVIDKDTIENTSNHIQYVVLGDLMPVISSTIYSKYNGDALRWGCKSLLLQFLIQKGFERLIYVDNDIYFYDTPQVIFDKLEFADFLLTPHFYQSNPHRESRWFEANYRVGLYNAGFIACTSKSKNILRWWQSCCEYNIKKRISRGLFDDQKYLDLVPVIFEGVEIVKDRAWNLAAWNDIDFDHIIELKVNELSPLFIHFTPLALEKWSEKKHPFYNYCQAYKDLLSNEGFSLTMSRKKHLVVEYLRYLFWKIERAFEK